MSLRDCGHPNPIYVKAHTKSGRLEHVAFWCQFCGALGMFGPEKEGPISWVRPNSAPASDRADKTQTLKYHGVEFKFTDLDARERRIWLYTFAGQALQGCMTTTSTWREVGIADLAEWAVHHAEALLAELEKREENRDE